MELIVALLLIGAPLLLLIRYFNTSLPSKPSPGRSLAPKAPSPPARSAEESVKEQTVIPVADIAPPASAGKTKLGLYKGKHYTAYVGTVKELKKRGEYGKAETLLLSLLPVIEAESRAEKWGVAPWYYEQLAIVYRKQREYGKEVAVLERYASQQAAPGVGPSKLEERLQKARDLALKGKL